MAKKKQVWNVGDIFLIKTRDMSFCVGQIVGREPQVLNSVSVALFDERTDGTKGTETLKLIQKSIFAILFTTRDLLDSGIWQVIENRPVSLPKKLLPFESLRSSGFVGASIQGSGNINNFVDAYYGFLPWDIYKNPNYFDDLLLSPDKKPVNLIFKK